MKKKVRMTKRKGVRKSVGKFFFAPKRRAIDKNGLQFGQRLGTDSACEFGADSRGESEMVVIIGRYIMYINKR